MPAELLFVLEPRRPLFATLVHHGNAATRALRAGVEPVHVRIVARLLDRAAGRAQPV